MNNQKSVIRIYHLEIIKLFQELQNRLAITLILSMYKTVLKGVVLLSSRTNSTNI